MTGPAVPRVGRLHSTCVEVTGSLDLVRGERTYLCGPDCPAVIPPDAARDARVAARRADDARRAGLALDRLLAGQRGALEDAYRLGYADGYRVARDDYGV